MAQQGHLYKAFGAWHVRYRVKKVVDGKLVSVQESHRLASTADYPLKSEVDGLRRQFMAKIHLALNIPEAGSTMDEFVEQVYFPSAERRLAESTVAGYRKAWNTHLKSRMAHRRVRDFRPFDCQAVMDALDDDHGNRLSHRTYTWLKVTMSAFFSHAVRCGVIDSNPVRNILTPKGRKRGRKTVAYSLNEIQQHLKVFAGDEEITFERKEGGVYISHTSRAVVRALIGTAAFAGLRQGEIRGLWADDDLGDVLYIRRTIWGTSLKEQTKTGEDEDEPGMVPIIEPLRKLLDAVKPPHGFIFTGSRGAALDLENFADRVMKPMLHAYGLRWAGWHAYRRGLATNLKEMGVDDLTIQAILRHKDVRTTQRFYIKTVPQQVTAAMREFASKVGCAMNVQ
jgi:site-specific recombinase XerD